MNSSTTRYAEFVKWLWNNKDAKDESGNKPLWCPGVLTKQGNPTATDLPQPPLQLIESLALFEYLEGHKLFFLQSKDKGNPIYNINTIEPHRWGAVIGDLELPEYRKSAEWKTLINVSRYLLVLMVGGAFGILIDLSKDEIKNEIKERRKNPPHQIPQITSPQNPTDKSKGEIPK